KREGKTADQAAADLAATWHEGLAKSGIDEAARAAAAEKMDLRILTPGARGARPVDVLGAISTPGLDPDDDDGWVEALRTTVSAVLELAGVKADPIRDPRHIVLTKILDEAWRSGSEITLPDLVVRLVDPPFRKVGAFPLDTVLPRKERMDLAVSINSLVASPSFAAWSEGEPLDIDRWMTRSGDRVPVNVVYLAHLGDTERQLAASLLVSRIASWSRRQPGSSDLRGVLVFDEAWGYLPPHPHNPSTKRPILQLLKQARAVGFGVVLATQNPVDLDYKAMSNAGTWFVGRLATPQDRDRVLDGAADEVHDWLDRMPKRGFWVRRPGSDDDQLMTSRWAMTWLRGPLTMPEVKQLVGEPEVADAQPEAQARALDGHWLAEPPTSSVAARFLDPAKARSPRLVEWLADVSQSPGPDGETLWMPALLAKVHVRFDERAWSTETEELRLTFPIEEGVTGEPALEAGDLFGAQPEGLFAPLPSGLDERSLTKRGRDIVSEIVRSERVMMYRHAGVRLVSTSAEDREAFEARVLEKLDDLADEKCEKVQDKADAAMEKLERRRRDLERDLEEKREDARARATTEAVNVGETLLGMLFGGRRKSLSGMASKRRQTAKAHARIRDLEAKLDDLDDDLDRLRRDLEEDLETVRAEAREDLADIDEKEVGLEKNDVAVTEWEIVWIPVSTPV
ncbi:MAG: hypothetical protein AAF211_18840, partial [Myxococcota bacterium]